MAKKKSKKKSSKKTRAKKGQRRAVRKTAKKAKKRAPKKRVPRKLVGSYSAIVTIQEAGGKRSVLNVIRNHGFSTAAKAKAWGKREGAMSARTAAALHGVRTTHFTTVLHSIAEAYQ